MLDFSVLPIFLLAVLALAIAPGPDLALIVSHALARGVRAGVWCSVGIALAGVLQTALVAFGLGQLMQRMPAIADAVRLVGAAYLMWIGMGMLMKVRRRGEGAAEAPRRIDLETSFAWLSRGLINNLLNPKALLFFSLFLPQFVTARGGEMPLQIVLLGLILTVVVMAVNVGVARAAGSVRRAFKPGGRFDHVGTGLLGLVFVGLALRMVFQGGRAR
jgi:threonine/homoserine/homoserine lactone efflux protein